MSNEEPTSNSLEPIIPIRIGAGSFATIFSSPGRSIVFKVAHSQLHSAIVRQEFNSLHSVYTLCSSESIFAIPRALAYYNPQTQEILSFPASLDSRRRGPRSHFDPEFFAKLPDSACYAMDRAAPLSRSIGESIRSKYYSERAIASGAAIPLLCRLYFGKTLGSSASRFINPNNFPLDVARYDRLWQEHRDFLCPTEDVAEGMGEMLSRIHWIAGYDARDVEFVMAGAPYSATTHLYVIDFNQMRAIDWDADDVSPLVDAFFSNDPYFPRPVPENALYRIFAKAYVDSCPEEHRRRAALFLRAIEGRRAAADAAASAKMSDP